MKRIGVVAVLILAFLGLANSAYLAQQETSGDPLLCNIQNFSGCNIVAASEYSKLFGIPLAEYGVLFYGILFVLAALELVIFDRLLQAPEPHTSGSLRRRRYFVSLFHVRPSFLNRRILHLLPC